MKIRIVRLKIHDVKKIRTFDRKIRKQTNGLTTSTKIRDLREKIHTDGKGRKFEYPKEKEKVVLCSRNVSYSTRDAGKTNVKNEGTHGAH